MPRWIQAMIWVSGRDIARDTIQTMLDARYADAWRHLRPHESGWTFPTWDPHIRLDYLFLPRASLGAVARCEVLMLDETRHASDHLPLLGELNLDSGI